MADLYLATRLSVTVREALDADGLSDVHSTVDAAEIPSAARAGVVCVSPPVYTFQTWGEPQIAWELTAVCGPPDNYLAAWDQLDRIVRALHAGQLNLARAEPGSYQPITGPALPAYTITLNDLEYE